MTEEIGCGEEELDARSDIVWVAVNRVEEEGKGETDMGAKKKKTVAHSLPKRAYKPCYHL